MKSSLSALTLLLSLEAASSFSIMPARSTVLSSATVLRPIAPATQLFMSDATTEDTTIDEDIIGMRLKEIQTELKERNASYTDCFDRESLTQRLMEARQGNARVEPAAEEPVTTAPPTNEPTPEPAAASEKQQSAPADFDRDATLQSLRAMRVAELRGECGKRNIRWATMLEKEELVQAVYKALESASKFSANITPGQVGALTDDQLSEELDEAVPKGTPLLLDVYATWCGPCQLMAPQLVEAAAEFGDTVRVAKIDSDKFPDWSRKLNVGAFPTLLVFDGNGKEVQRVEGALMKNQILDLVKAHL